MSRLCSLGLLLLTAPLTAAADWPQWLGPTRDGVTKEIVKPWTSPPKVLWRKAVGEGHSSPVVANGRVYLLTKARDKEMEELTAFDAVSGAIAWQTPYERANFKNPFGNGPRATPTVANDRVYTYGSTGVLSCFEEGSGKRLWHVDTLKDFRAKNLFFGASCSPLVEAGRVLVNVGGPGAGVVAFNAADGSVAWKALDDRASYAFPIAFGEGPSRQAVFLTQQGLRSLKIADGTALWDFPLVDKLFESSTTPVRMGDLVLASSITFGSVGLRLTSKDGKPAVEQAWKKPELTCYFSTPMPVGTDHVYLVKGSIPLKGKPVQAALCCVESKTGEVLWTRPRIGEYHAALLRTGDDKLLLLDDFSNLILLQPDPKDYRELARSPVCGKTWAHPALANGRLYVRDEKELICLQLGE